MSKVRSFKQSGMASRPRDVGRCWIISFVLTPEQTYKSALLEPNGRWPIVFQTRFEAEMRCASMGMAGVFEVREVPPDAPVH